MPSHPLWFTKLPQILEAIEDYPDVLDRSHIEKLLEVGPRTAHDLLSNAGGELQGKSYRILRDDFARYLRIRGGPQLDAEERRRRRNFAKKFVQLEREAIERPKLLVDLETISPDQIKRSRKKGMAGLPEGIVVSPGRVVIECEDGVEAAQKLTLLCMAIGSDFDGFEEAVKSKTPIAEQSSAPAREETGGGAPTAEVA